MTAGRILVVDERSPRPDRDGGSLRMRNLLAILAGLADEVAFAPLERAADDPPLELEGVRLVDEPPAEHISRAGGRYDTVLLSRPEVAALKSYAAPAVSVSVKDGRR